MRNDCFVLPDHAQCRMASLPFPQVLLCILYHLSEQLPAGYLQSSCNQTAASYPAEPPEFGHLDRETPFPQLQPCQSATAYLQ